MSYFAPYVDDSGFHIPTYTDIRDQLIINAKSIFGQDIYLGIDSQDYQWISAVSNMVYDSFQAAQLAYNGRSPVTSIGSALDSIVKINGIKRLPATASTCLVDIEGTAGIPITKGVVSDVNGVKWDLPDSVIINPLGTTQVLATCEVVGPISANIGEITTIETPTYGWDSVNNSVAATLGVSVESDSSLRARQSISTAQPSRTVLEGTKGEISALVGVTRLEIYENDTNTVDSNGLPAHSITCIVEGGQDVDIATTIFNKKGPGCYTNGDVVIPITDAYSQVVNIKFFRPTYVDIDVVINIKALQGYTSQITDNIQNSIVNYLNSLSIGGNLSVSSLWGVALGSNINIAKPNFSITSLTAARHGSAQGTTDIDLSFKEITRGILANVSIIVS